MTTHRITSRVSLAAALAITVTIAGCVSGHSADTPEARPAASGYPVTIRFDNTANDYVHVYLVGERREWLLGRVEPGARATLRVPDAALADGAESIQLAVMPGSRVTLQAKRDARTVITILQPTAELLSQRWSYSQLQATGRLISLPVDRARIPAADNGSRQ